MPIKKNPNSTAPSGKAATSCAAAWTGKGKEMVDRLSNLVAIFDNPALDFRGNRAEGDDLLGDAYEYLMRHFATESGKSKGQFYTPAEVSRIMAKVIGVGERQERQPDHPRPDLRLGLAAAQGARRGEGRAPGSTSRSTARRWTTPPRRWPG